MIKRKDGSVYKLQSPNPVMRTQEIWDNYTLHNCSWNGIILPGERPIVQQMAVKPKNQTVQYGIPKNFDDILVKPETKVEPKPPPVIVKPNNPGLIIAWCLPAQIKTYKDELYGEVRKTIQYGEKFQFPLDITDQSDTYIRFLTDTNLSQGSVIFPKNRQNRWWKVVDIVATDDKFLVDAIISEFQPDFTG